MFKDKSDNHADPRSDSVETIIGPSVKLEGEFKSDGDIVVEGSVSGSLSTKNRLRVGDQAKIKADIEAGNAVIAGEVNGNLIIKGSLELGAKAKIKGNIDCSLLVVTEGALINGQVVMGREEAKPAPSGSPKQDEAKKF